MKLFSTNLGSGGGGGGGSSVDSITVTISEEGGVPIAAGFVGYLSIPYAATINEWVIIGKESGSIVVDVWKDTYANFPPTVADSITGTEKPTLSSAQINRDQALSTWTTSIAAGDVMAFNVDSASTVTQVTLVLKVTKS